VGLFAGLAAAAEDGEPGGPRPAEDVQEPKPAPWPAYAFSEGGFQLHQSESPKQRLALGGNIFARYGCWDWFAGPGGDNNYGCGFQRTRLRLRYLTDYLSVFFEPQYVHMCGVPDDAFKPPPEGPLGMGGLYYIHNRDTGPYDLGVHQAYLAIHPPGRRWLLKLGRFEYSDGLEVMQKADGKHFNALKVMRLGDRLISPFGWSAFGRSFDGGLIQYDRDEVNVTASVFYPTQGGWEEDVDTTMDDIRILTLTVTGKRGRVLPGTEVAAFYYRYTDGREVTQRVDNSGMPADEVDIDIHMFGAHAVGVYDIGPGTADVLLWGGAQVGEWYELHHRAYALAAEAGYRFSAVPGSPWVRAGYYLSSGDDAAADDDHETFFQMAPGTRKYNLCPYCDLMNIEDVFVQLIVHPLKRLMVRTDYHLLRLNAEEDRWYMGSGPTQRRGGIFGYVGRPTGGSDELAQELDVMLQYKLDEHCTLLGSYSHIWGDDVVGGVYNRDDDADYLSVGFSFDF
jgi:hypothetical protein